MKDILGRICGLPVTSPDVVEKVVIDHVALGKAKPLLREGVEARPLTTASGEPYVALESPESAETISIPVSVHELCQHLDGETTVQAAVDATLRNGSFPVGFQGHLQKMHSLGMFQDPDGALAECFRVRREGALSESEESFLWGKKIPGPTLDWVLPLLRPISSLVSNAFLFWMLLAFGICGFAGFWGLVKSGDTVLLTSGPEIFWVKLLGIWVASVLGQLLCASTLASPKQGRSALSWKLYLGIPLLTVDDASLKGLSWKEALRRRLSGAVSLWSIAALGALALWRVETPRFDEVLVVVSSVSFLIGFLHLSPWWKSPLRDSVRQAMPEIDYPWTSWNFLWKGLWKALFGNQPLGKHGTGLVISSLYLLAWTLVAVRLSTFILRNMALQLYLDGKNAEHPAHGLALKIAAAVVAVLAVLAVVNVVLLFVFRALSALKNLSVWDAHRNLFSTFLILGLALGMVPVLLPAQFSEAGRWLGFFLVYIFLGSFFAFALRPEFRTYFSSAFLVLSIWCFTSVLSLLGEVISGEVMTLESVLYVRWPVFFPIAAIFLFVDTHLRNRGRDLSLWPGVIVAFLVIFLGRNFTPGYRELAILFGIAAALMLAWGFLEVGGWYRRLTYYFAAVLAILTLAAIGYSQVDRGSSPLLRFSAGLTGMTLLFLVPITYRLLLERKPKVPPAPAQDLPGSERDLLLQSVNQFWQPIQERIAFIAGERIALNASSAASHASTVLEFGMSSVTLASSADSDLEELAKDLDHSFSAASRIWLAACGTAAVANAGEGSLLALDWERRNVFAEYLLRPGGWWTALFPKGAHALRADPESFLKHRPIFSQLTPDQQRLVLSNVRSLHFKPGETILQQGEFCGRFYYITEGHAEVVSESVLSGPKRAVLRRDDSFGQTAFLTGKPQTSTVRAIDDLWVFCIDRSDVPELIPEILKKIPSAVGEKKMARLTKIPLFKSLSAVEIELLAERAHYVEFAAGATIIRQGETEGDFYVIDEGSVEVSRDGEKVATLVAGEYFGEIALLLSVPRTATVTAATDCRCIQISCEEFKKLLSESTFHGQLARMVDRRAV